MINLDVHEPFTAIRDNSLNVMRTLVVDVSEASALELASSAVIAGESIVIPTDTVYGLACKAMDGEAVSRLFALKGRELEKVSAVFVSSVDKITDIAEVDAAARRVIEKFLPGKLTVILKSKVGPIPGVVGNDMKIGVRVAQHEFVSELCRRVGGPLIATSANISGNPDCKSRSDVIETFSTIVPLIVTESNDRADSPSTVVDLTTNPIRLIREGTIAFSEVLNSAEERT